ncbi:ABC transporter permease [Pandoraea communis]|nr:ABC transporter permease [Pandoraea communis]MDM8359092.1 ABC transporter permease [Pandoraea communis]
MARVFAKEAQYELLKLVRERAYVFSVIGLPVVFFLVFGIAHPNQRVQGQPVSRYLLASYSAFGAMGAALFAIGVGLVTERSHGWLALKRASPMPTYSYLTAKVVAALAFGELITVTLMALGVVAAGMPISGIEIIRLSVAIAGGVFAFSALGVFLGLILSPGSAVGMINLVYLPLSLCGGLWVPLDMLPKWLKSIAPLLPSYQFSRLTLHALGYPIGAAWSAWGLLFAYGAMFTLLSVWLFRRRELAC